MAAASRTDDLALSEIESWVEDARGGMETAPKADPLDVRRHDEKRRRDLQETHSEAGLELMARQKGQALMERD